MEGKFTTLSATDAHKLSRAHRRRRIVRKTCLALLALVFAAFGAFFYVEARLTPIVLSMAEARVLDLSGRALNEAVMDMDAISGGIAYEDLIEIQKDAAGRVTVVKANTLRMSQLASKTALLAQQKISGIGNQGISVPLGNALGSQLLSGKGPPIRMELIPVGSVAPRFESTFEAAGINQTRHLVYLCLEADMRIVLPGGSRTTHISTQVPIAETLIVGEVPTTVFQGAMPPALRLVP